MQGRGVRVSAVPRACTSWRRIRRTRVVARARSCQRGAHLSPRGRRPETTRGTTDVRLGNGTVGGGYGRRFQRGPSAVRIPQLPVVGDRRAEGTAAAQSGLRQAPLERATCQEGDAGIPEPLNDTVRRASRFDQTMIPPGVLGGITCSCRVGVASPPSAALGGSDGTQPGVLGQHDGDGLGPPQTVGVPLGVGHLDAVPPFVPDDAGDVTLSHAPGSSSRVDGLEHGRLVPGWSAAGYPRLARPAMGATGMRSLAEMVRGRPRSVAGNDTVTLPVAALPTTNVPESFGGVKVEPL